MPNRRKIRRWLIAPPVVIGVGVVAVLVARRAGPERALTEEAVYPLRVIRVEPTAVVPRVTGYGTARPSRVWRAVAEVAGRVVGVHPDLRSGTLLPEGAELVRIDPSEYELAIAKLRSEIGEAEAQIAELDASEGNLRASLEIEEASLAIVAADSERARAAFDRNAATLSDINTHERLVLEQRRRVQELRNSIALLPTQRRTAEARRAERQSQLAVAELDLSKTVIRAPFACRVGEVSLLQGQFVQRYEPLFDVSGIDRAEVEAQVRVGGLRALVGEGRFDGINIEELDLASLRSALNLTAEVRLDLGGVTARWDASFDRVRETIDPVTRTAGVLVAVDHPYEQFIPGERPPLLEGAYCEVELRGAELPGRLVVPRSALTDGTVAVVDADGRLARRAVRVGLQLSGFAAIEEGLSPGDTVVVSDPVGVPLGSSVSPILDARTAAALAADAAGTPP